jgi:L-asparaginase II
MERELVDELTIENAAPPLVEVMRGEIAESFHRGSIAVVDGAGGLVARLGSTGFQTYYRSAAKPFQALPLITSGAFEAFGLSAHELATIVGSHGGEEIHLEAVASILDRVGISDEALQCGAHMPFDERASRALRAAGKAPTVRHNNCSGKHAGMLALAKFRGEPLESYLDPEHPVQREIRAVVGLFAGVAPAEISVAIDGCSAPVFGVPLEAMARSYARLVNPADQSDPVRAGMAGATRRVVAAMTGHPEMVAGTHGRLDTDLMHALPGLIISKVGAEGVQLLGVLPGNRYPSGLGIAIKIEDGDIRRARDPVVIETLRQLGLLDDDHLARLAGYAGSKVLNHRRLVVGEVRPCFSLQIAE